MSISDPILVIGNTVMEMPLYAPFRRKERFAIRRTIGERISKSNARVVSAPVPQHESEQTGYGPGPFLEVATVARAPDDDRMLGRFAIAAVE